MIKTEVLDGSKKKKKIVLLNPDAIVSVEEVEEDLYQIFLIDGRMYYMTLQMFQENFEEEEEIKRS